MLFDENIFTADNFYPITAFQQGILYKVEYTADETKLNPKIRIGNKEQMTLLFEKLGVYKNKYWAFQKEWRYILFFLPWSYEEFFNAQKKLIYEHDDSGIKNIFWKIEKCPELHFNYFFLNIRDDALNQMEILLSPKISDGNKHIVDLLLKEHNKNIKVISSTLTGKIK